MSESIVFFNEVARVGSKILKTLASAPATDAVKGYLEHVGDIYTLLAKIHDRLIEAAINASVAINMDEVREALGGIERINLENTFRARHWCDKLEMLGKALGPLIQDAGISGDDEKIWREFCDKLQMREREVAYLYDEKLYDLQTLTASEPSLESLRQKVEDISDELVLQKARFDQLAMKAKAMLERVD